MLCSWESPFGNCLSGAPGGDYLSRGIVDCRGAPTDTAFMGLTSCRRITIAKTLARRRRECAIGHHADCRVAAERYTLICGGPALIPRSDSTPSSEPPTSPSYPATPPSNSSPGWRQPASPPPSSAGNTQATPALTNPPPTQHRIQVHQPAPRMRPGLEHVTGPHMSSATSSNRYINGRSAYSASTGDWAPEPVNNRRSGVLSVGVPRRLGSSM